MKGKTWLFWGGLIAAAGAVLFQTSYDVQDLEEKLAGLNRKIVIEQESIQVLRAEWSYLNDPAKLEELARAHLALQPTEARQFVALDSLPMRPAQAPDAIPQPSPLPGRGVNPALPASVVPVAANTPPTTPATARATVATARIQPPTPKLSMDKALEKTPVIVPAALPVVPTVKSAPIKPSTLIPAAAKAPPPPPATPAQAPAPATAAPQPVPTALPSGKMAPNAPLPSLNRPTDVASRPLPPIPSAAKALTTAHQPKATDSLGLLVARLGANR